MMSFICLSIILPNLQSSDKYNPAVRMFYKSYDQIMGVEKNQDFNDKKNIRESISFFT